MPKLNRYTLDTVVARLNKRPVLVERFRRIIYAKKRKPAGGQGGFDFDEKKHPRDGEGKFAEKGEGGSKSGGSVSGKESAPAKPDRLAGYRESLADAKEFLADVAKKEWTGKAVAVADAESMIRELERKIEKESGNRKPAVDDKSEKATEQSDEPFTLSTKPAPAKPAPVAENVPTRQKQLLSGLDALPGQMDLFGDVDKAEEAGDEKTAAKSTSHDFSHFRTIKDYEDGAILPVELYDGLPVFGDEESGLTVRVEQRPNGHYDVWQQSQSNSEGKNPYATDRDVDVARHAAWRAARHDPIKSPSGMARIIENQRRLLEAAKKAGAKIPEHLQADFPSLKDRFARAFSTHRQPVRYDARPKRAQGQQAMFTPPAQQARGGTQQPLDLHWVTIGGSDDGDGHQHAGGTAVQIDGSGKIHSGPGWLAEKGITVVEYLIRAMRDAYQQRYAKGKPAPGQRGLFDEAEHPRDQAGKFSEKSESGLASQSENSRLTESTKEAPAVEKHPGAGQEPSKEIPAMSNVDHAEPAVKQPWEMTLAEFEAAGHRGYIDAHRKAILEAMRAGKPVPQEIIGKYADTVEEQHTAALKADYGDDYVDRLKALAGRVGQSSGVLRTNESGSLTVRQKQLPRGGFYEFAKGDVYASDDGPKIVAKALKPRKLVIDGQTYAYTQDITLRDPKPAEEAEAKASLLAKDALAALVTQGANRDYSDLKHKQMDQHREHMRQIFGQPKNS